MLLMAISRMQGSAYVNCVKVLSTVHRCTFVNDTDCTVLMQLPFYTFYSFVYLSILNLV